MTKSDKSNSKAINTILVVMALVGVVTLLIVLVSVFGGMWLDKQFGTGQIFTFGLVLAGIPITIFVMYKIARVTVARIAKSKEENKTTDS
jgi:amino acid transporter